MLQSPVQHTLSELLMNCALKKASGVDYGTTYGKWHRSLVEHSELPASLERFPNYTNDGDYLLISLLTGLQPPDLDGVRARSSLHPISTFYWNFNVPHDST